MNYPPHYGYQQPPPPRSSGPNVLLIVLIVLGVLLLLGGGGCLLCVGIAASTAEPSEPQITTTTATATAPPITAPTVTPPALPTVVPPPTPAAPRVPVARKRTVDFTCPPGKKAGGAVRAGCLCGDDIIGTACGAPGNFTDVTELPNGCRFTCN